MTIEECEQLIGQLSHCKLPFQCAHGRPTAMPLLNLSQLTKMPQSVMEVRYDLLYAATLRYQLHRSATTGSDF